LAGAGNTSFEISNRFLDQTELFHLLPQELAQIFQNWMNIKSS
jgi:hypothetical protein